MPYDEGRWEDFTLLSTDSLTDAQDDSISELCSSLKIITSFEKFYFNVDAKQTKHNNGQHATFYFLLCLHHVIRSTVCPEWEFNDFERFWKVPDLAVFLKYKVQGSQCKKLELQSFNGAIFRASRSQLIFSNCACYSGSHRNDRILLKIANFPIWTNFQQNQLV